jgi:hypothetical protein
MCQLPECDRSFTRSDALAKHMRTVHETEALRPSDPVPRGHTGGISNGGSSAMPPKRLKLTMGSKTNGDKKATLVGDLPALPTRYTASKMGINLGDVTMADDDGGDEQAEAVDADMVPVTLPLPADYYPPETSEDMDDYERSLAPSQWFRLLRRQIHWAEQEGMELQHELEELRATTDDAEGHPLKKGQGDEKGADENRRAEWQRSEDILDALLRAEAGQAIEMITGEAPDSGSQQNPWEMLKVAQALTTTSAA